VTLGTRSTVHPTAIVDPRAVLAEGVEVGPYAVIGAGVTLGPGCVVGAHAVIEGPAEFGRDNRIAPHAALGFAPQDLKYRGEETWLRVGASNVFREFSTVHRGTVGGGGITTIGDHNFLMAYIHIAHDCHIGSHVIFANCASLAGHVSVGDHATLGAFTAIHQFARVGPYAWTGAFTAGRMDILPFVKTSGMDSKTFGINAIGLKRRGFSDERVEALKKAYRILVQSKLNTSQALERIEAELAGQPDVDLLARFIRESERGVHK
jgi:UDP-N-acetylglucosamine acyltransferase